MADGANDKPGLRSAATLLLSLGEGPAAELLNYLSAKDFQRIGTAMTSLGPLSKVEVAETCKKFLELAEEQASVGLGADDYIRSMLTNALGEDKANGLIDRILFGRSSKGLETLKWMDPRGVAETIRHEHPQTIAVVLAYLEPEHASEIVIRLPENLRAEVLSRVATLDGLQPSALSHLDEVIERQFSGKSATRTATLGGAKATAAILNRLDGSEETAILEAIRRGDEQLASTIEDLIFTFHDLMAVEDRDLQTLLREISSDVLIPALKAADEELRTKFFKNVSQRAAEMLKDDIDARGPVKLSDAEAAQKQILQTARQMADAGTISLGGKGESYV
jgi:flagellar motor switch protein FliG